MCVQGKGVAKEQNHYMYWIEEEKMKKMFVETIQQLQLAKPIRGEIDISKDLEYYLCMIT